MYPEDIDRLQQEFGIAAVLSAQTEDDFAYWGIGWRRLESHYRRTGVEYRRVPVRDFDPEDLRRKLPRCVEVLDELLRQGHTVFVHCTGGVNRSPSIAIAYLHWVQGWSLERAADHVRKCRSCEPYLEAIRLASQDRDNAR
jgi:protein-tyrosine phosphatase